MKNLGPKLIEILHSGCCTPQLMSLAKRLKEPTTTIHYNIKKMEKDGTIRAYKAVFDYEKIERGFLITALINITDKADDDPEAIARKISCLPEVESLNICTGEWEMVARIRVKDENEYYTFVKHILQMPGIKKVLSLVALREFKTEYVEIP